MQNVTLLLKSCRLVDPSKKKSCRLCTVFLATRNAWKAIRHPRAQIVMKLNAARTNDSGKVLTKLKTPALVISILVLILLTVNANMNV